MGYVRLWVDGDEVSMPDAEACETCGGARVVRVEGEDETCLACRGAGVETKV